MNSTSAFVAYLTTGGIGICIIWLGVTVGMLIARKTGYRWIGWIVGLSIACAAFVSAIPVTHSLKVIECRADDHPDWCMNDY